MVSLPNRLRVQSSGSLGAHPSRLPLHVHIARRLPPVHVHSQDRTEIAFEVDEAEVEGGHEYSASFADFVTEAIEYIEDISESYEDESLAQSAEARYHLHRMLSNFSPEPSKSNFKPNAASQYLQNADSTESEQVMTCHCQKAARKMQSCRAFLVASCYVACQLGNELMVIHQFFCMLPCKAA